MCVRRKPDVGTSLIPVAKSITVFATRCMFMQTDILITSSARKHPATIPAMTTRYHPFPNTHWSLVHRAGIATGDARRDALTALLARYEPALRSYLRHVRHIPADAADDLLQSFITDKLLEQQLLQHADQRRGRFRSFLLTSLNNFAASRQRDAHAPPAEPLHPELSLADLKVPAPHAAVDAAWARALVRDVLVAMREECLRLGRQDLWTIFDARILTDLFEGQTPVPYEQLAADLKLESPSQAANLLITAKRMYARLLRLAVAEYEQPSDAVEEEIADLRRSLATGPVVEPFT